MRYRLLGRSGLRVSELCLGAMVFGDTREPWGATREDAQTIVERFGEAGGNFIDTASNYAPQRCRPDDEDVEVALDESFDPGR
jgi:aryl-alcohol dehydrogenase-like predicted oxidoreductase